jgi:dihydrodipicolinate synthase/N-acetylneuraminate lyase
MNRILKELLDRGLVIPAMPLALDANRRLDERRQRALVRYYAAAGAGGLAAGVHTTQFAIRDPKHALFAPVLRFVSQVMDEIDGGLDGARIAPLLRVGGVCGQTAQAVCEATFLREQGFHAGLLNLGAMKASSEDESITHCQRIGEILPVFGFFLSTAVGGRELPYSFWRRFAEIHAVTAIKIACFNRYQTIDCMRAVAESGRTDIALYTGNDDNILLDLLTPFCFRLGGKRMERRIVGGLLGHWAVWTRRAVEHLAVCHAAAATERSFPFELLQLANEITDANAAFFDPSHQFRGCIPGIHSVLVRQGLLEGAWCLDPTEGLSQGQAAEIDRVYADYPHLNDDLFVAEHRDRWLR